MPVIRVVAVDDLYRLSEKMNPGSTLQMWSGRVCLWFFSLLMEISIFAVRGIKEGATDFIVRPWDNRKRWKILLNAAQAIA